MTALDLEKEARIRTLINAIEHGGRASLHAVVGKLVAEFPELKKNIREVVKVVSRTVEEVNALPLEEQRRLLSELRAPEVAVERAVREVKPKELPPLPEAEKYRVLVTRFAPNPDSVLHLGSARAAVLSHDYARKYGGIFILRFEDTDPRIKKAALSFYDYIREDLLWLKCKWDEEYLQSERLELYYDCARELIRLGKAYVSTTPREEFSRLVREEKATEDRELSPGEHLQRFERMLNGGYREGEAVLRIKTDLSHPNLAVRDWPALRIINTKKYPHPKMGSKYTVWPLYNFSVAVDDHLMKITHIIRGKEHLVNTIRQRFLYAHLGWEYPTAIHYGRLKIEGGVLSKSKIMSGVARGEYWGLDDPRLATLKALRKRGIHPDAVRDMVYGVGLSPSEATITWDMIHSLNKRIIDPTSPRYFAVFEPRVLVLEGPWEGDMLTVTAPKHPGRKEMGYRRIDVRIEDRNLKLVVQLSDVPLISRAPFFRLMYLANAHCLVEEEGVLKARFRSISVEEAKEAKAPLVHWLPMDTTSRLVLYLQTGEIKEGLIEPSALAEEEGRIIQLERVGFARIDRKVGSTVIAYFASK